MEALALKEEINDQELIDLQDQIFAPAQAQQIKELLENKTT